MSAVGDAVIDTCPRHGPGEEGLRHGLAEDCGHVDSMREARGDLLVAASELGVDELRVLTRIAWRLAAGARHYGVLDVARDARDFDGKEAREEVEDALVYFACAWLKREAMKGGVQ